MWILVGSVPVFIPDNKDEEDTEEESSVYYLLHSTEERMKQVEKDLRHFSMCLAILAFTTLFAGIVMFLSVMFCIFGKFW